MFAAFQVFQTADRITKLLQDNSKASFDPIVASPIIDGALVSLGDTKTPAFKTANTDVTVYHTLGRAPVGYFVAGLSAAAIIFTSPTANSKPTSQIIMQASAALQTASLWFF
jgi:hypothetical protein